MYGEAGRTADFSDASDFARDNTLTSLQKPSRVYEPTSVYDNVVPNPNGISQQDLQRQMVGFDESPLGRSQSTYERGLWLRDSQRSLTNYRNG